MSIPTLSTQTQIAFSAKEIPFSSVQDIARCKPGPIWWVGMAKRPASNNEISQEEQ
jgi:hypothetical protein